MMTSVSRGLVVLSCVVAVLSGAMAHAGVRPMPEATVNVALSSNTKQVERNILTSINAQRNANGLRKLQLNAKLSRAAQKHADDMTRRGYFSHTAPDGTRPLARVTKVGYKGCLVAENLSYSWKSVDLAMADWMRSSGHRSNVLHPQFKEVGIGIGPNNLFVTVFATPCR